ncbi:MAG TPA: DUF3237 domain-containing protein [Acidimicrobiales bacterium]|jgi:hypothetical protein
MSIELIHLCRLTIEIDDHTRLPGAPSGDRLVGTSTNYRIDGQRIRGIARSTPATDWVTVRAGGSGTVDARMLIETDDGALILIRYEGRIVYTEDGATVIVAPTFETNDERYDWLNSIQAIGKGERVGTTLVYEFYQAS